LLRWEGLLAGERPVLQPGQCHRVPHLGIRVLPDHSEQQHGLLRGQRRRWWWWMSDWRYAVRQWLHAGGQLVLPRWAA
jgi:hypothetical protein